MTTSRIFFTAYEVIGNPIRRLKYNCILVFFFVQTAFGKNLQRSDTQIRLAEVAKKQALIFDFAKTLQTQKQL